MRRFFPFAVLVLDLLVATPSAVAQNSADFAFLWPKYGSESVSFAGDRATADLQSRFGFGLGFTHQQPRWAVSIDARRLRAPGVATIDGERLSIGTLDLTPITVLVDFRSGPAFVGAGVADVRTGDLRSQDLDLAGVGKVAIGDDVTMVIHGGVGVPLRGPLQLDFEGRYMPVNVSARAAGQSAKLKFNVLTFGAVLRWKY